MGDEQNRQDARVIVHVLSSKVNRASKFIESTIEDNLNLNDALPER